MKNILSFVFMYLIFFTATVCNAQPSADNLLDQVIGNYQKVKKYTADIQIITDIAFIKILPMKASINFEQPNKMKLVSKGIAILPRQGFDEMYKAITDRKSYTIVSQGNELVENINTAVISMLPLSDTMEVVLGKFWIDTEKNVILKSQMTTRTNGTVLATYVYGLQASYGLPDKITFIIDVKKFKIPKTVAVDINNYKKEEASKNKDNKKGKITILLSKYVINK